MESCAVHEPVDVAAVFCRTAIKPKWFVWNNRKYPVREVTYVWHDREGEAELVCFAVTDGSTLFELSFNRKTLGWRLERTVME